MKNYALILLAMTLFIGCKKKEEETPIVSEDWETVNPISLGWNTTELGNLKQFLIDENSKSFMILVDGKIVVEYYLNGHSASNTWQWNSAGKTLVTATVGMAQQEGYLDINQPVSTYLGTNWTNMPSEKEDLITVRHLLSMTSGIDETNQFVSQPNLTYVADAGDRWAYGNVFQKLMDVVSESTNQDFRTYFENKIANKLGMTGSWNYGLIFKIYHSDTRSMAKFGHFALEKGKSECEQILNQSYFEESINSSQSINPAYGYMWWLNGKSSFMVPSSQDSYPGMLIPNAPNDIHSALGKDDQKIYVVPSKNMVVVRMGEAATSGNNFALSSFDNLLWEKINAVIN